MTKKKGYTSEKIEVRHLITNTIGEDTFSVTVGIEPAGVAYIESMTTLLPIKARIPMDRETIRRVRGDLAIINDALDFIEIQATKDDGSGDMVSYVTQAAKKEFYESQPSDIQKLIDDGELVIFASKGGAKVWMRNKNKSREDAKS